MVSGCFGVIRSDFLVMAIAPDPGGYLLLLSTQVEGLVAKETKTSSHRDIEEVLKVSDSYLEGPIS